MKLFLRVAIALLPFIALELTAQDSYRETFIQANLLTEDGVYGLAIPMWEQLLAEDPDNANIQYKLGRCYLGLGIDRQQALPYLRKATRKINKNYDPFMFNVPGAPTEAYFYAGQAYHLNNDLDSAEYFYQQFLDNAGKKHFLREDAEKGLQMCANARELMQNPIDVSITSLGTPVNSEFSDYAPIISLDENTLYFTSRRMRPDGSNAEILEGKTGMFYEDMYVSYKTIDGRWMNPELLNINSPDEHSSVLSMAPDGRKLYVYKTYNGRANLYESDYEDGRGWGAPSLIGSDVNSKHNEYFATITSDGQLLYFVSDRPGGLGGKDIWYSKKLPNGEWGEALNMGAPVNTEEDEDAPYLHPDGKTMYFSSNGHKSMGGYDIFYSQQDDAGQWQTPVNIGYPINTTDDDICFITTPSGNRAYYASRSENAEGSSDIFVVDFKDEAQTPEFDLSTFAVLKGWILTPQNRSLPENLRIEIFNKASGELEGVAKPVARNGSFVFIIPSGNSYDLNYLVDDEVALSETVVIPLGTEYQEIPREIFLKPEKGGSTSLVSLNERVLGNVVRWKLGYSDKSRSVPIGSRVYFYDKSGNVVDTVLVSKDGYFLFQKLAPDESYIFSVEMQDVSSFPMEIQLVDESGVPGEITMVQHKDGKFYEKGKVPGTEDAVVAAKAPKAGATSPVKKTPNKQLKISGKAKEFYLFYDYNQVEMEEEDPTFAAAMAAARTLIQAGKKASIRIEGSASKVPTSAYATNEKLAQARLEKIQEAMQAQAGKFGFDQNELRFKDLQSLVQGPNFDPEANQPKALFIEYQYVRIVVN